VPPCIIWALQIMLQRTFLLLFKSNIIIITVIIIIIKHYKNTMFSRLWTCRRMLQHTTQLMPNIPADHRLLFILTELIKRQQHIGYLACAYFTVHMNEQDLPQCGLIQWQCTSRTEYLRLNTEQRSYNSHVQKQDRPTVSILNEISDSHCGEC
jgi:hypothetical protein